jgi:lipoprotein-anchoring transpeptidase ErfK/SrfK
MAEHTEHTMSPRAAVHDVRHEARAQRLAREAAGRRRQRFVLFALVVLTVVGGTAYALIPKAAPSQAVSTPAVEAAVAVPGGDVPAASAVVATVSVEATDGAPSAPATPTQEATPAAPVHKPLRPAPGVKTIVVDKSEQRVTLYTAQGAWVDSFLCASGRTYPRIGRYKVYGRRKQSWSLYDNTTFFYFVMFVKSDKGNNIGFHSIPQYANGELAGGLGKPVSHGCVRLAKTKAKFVYTWAKNGTRVVVKK